MAGYHRVRAKYWPDMRGMSRNAKLLGVYVLTCTHRATEGLFHLPVAYAAEDLEMPAAQVRKALAELEAREFIAYDEQAQVVLIVKALTYPDQVPKTEKQVIGAKNALAHVPASPLWERFRALAAEHAPTLAAALNGGTPSEPHS